MSLTYFSRFSSGEQLWVSDGTVAGARLVTTFIAGSSFRTLTAVGARAYFSVDDGTHGNELWSSDGTAAGTVLVKDINPGAGDSNPFFLTNVNGKLFFRANDGTHGDELWQSDGTAAGTVMVNDIRPGSGGSTVTNLTNVNGTLFFDAFSDAESIELWKSDGTAAGTVLVKDINPGLGSSEPFALTNVNGTLFFDADDGTHGFELWKSDGTAAGTVLVKDINPGTGGSIPFGLVNVGGTVFFGANDGTHGNELWKSDGTASGTVLVRDINPGAGDSSVFGLTNVNGTLFFEASDGAGGVELWKSDGTAAGTVLVRDINPGAASSNPQNLVNVNGTLFFQADDGIHGNELWKSDGTTAGTVMVKDINVSSFGFSMQSPTNVNGVLEFYGFDGANENLFRSDGTAAGTFALAVGIDSNTPLGFTPPPRSDDFNNDGNSDILWRNANGVLADWSMNGGTISSGFLTSNGTVVAPDASWSVAGLSDFNGDGNTDVLWRNASGMLADWAMTGSTITSSASVTSSGAVVAPDVSWTVAGVGDFNGDGKSDILWRNASGELIDWLMNGSLIVSSGDIAAGGVAVAPDMSWSVAGIGDFDGDGKRDILWRNRSGEIVDWLMNGPTIESSRAITFNTIAIVPDASWSVAGVGDFNGDGKSDVLWHNTNGSVVEWLLNGSVISSSAAVTSNGAAVSVDATWHVVESGDFNGDSKNDVLWRNDNGALAEWLMNGNRVSQSLAPASNGTSIRPDGSWRPQAMPTDFA